MFCETEYQFYPNQSNMEYNEISLMARINWINLKVCPLKDIQLNFPLTDASKWYFKSSHVHSMPQ